MNIGLANEPGHSRSETKEPLSSSRRLQFDRVELAGAFGDLGTLLPMVVSMIFINKLSPSSVFLAFGLFYIMAGYYYRLPIPVQPLKAVGAIAIAYPAVISESVIGASGIIFGAFLLIVSLTGLMDWMAKLFSQAVVRVIQLTLGLIFLKKGFELIIHRDIFMSGVQSSLPGYPINLLVGIIVFCLVLLLLDNKNSQQPSLLLLLERSQGLLLAAIQTSRYHLDLPR